MLFGRVCGVDITLGPFRSGELRGGGNCFELGKNVALLFAWCNAGGGSHTLGHTFIASPIKLPKEYLEMSHSSQKYEKTRLLRNIRYHPSKYSCRRWNDDISMCCAVLRSQERKCTCTSRQMKLLWTRYGFLMLSNSHRLQCSSDLIDTANSS